MYDATASFASKSKNVIANITAPAVNISLSSLLVTLTGTDDGILYKTKKPKSATAGKNNSVFTAKKSAMMAANTMPQLIIVT